MLLRLAVFRVNVIKRHRGSIRFWLVNVLNFPASVECPFTQSILRRLLVDIPLVQNKARAHAAIGAVFPRLGIVARHAILFKAATTLIEHSIGYFFAASGTSAYLLIHS
jgi:hypothetical protein